LSLLLVHYSAPRSFSPGSPVSPLLKNQHFQIPIRSGNARPRLNEFFELLGAPWVNKLHLHLHLHFEEPAVVKIPRLHLRFGSFQKFTLICSSSPFVIRILMQNFPFLHKTEGDVSILRPPRLLPVINPS